MCVLGVRWFRCEYTKFTSKSTEFYAIWTWIHAMFYEACFRGEKSACHAESYCTSCNIMCLWGFLTFFCLQSVSALIQTHWNQHQHLQHKHTQLHKFSPWRLTSTWRQEVNVTQQPPPLVLPLSGGETLCNNHPLSLQVMNLTSLFSSHRASSALTPRQGSQRFATTPLSLSRKTICVRGSSGNTALEMQESSVSEKRQRGGWGGCWRRKDNNWHLREFHRDG